MAFLPTHDPFPAFYQMYGVFQGEGEPMVTTHENDLWSFGLLTGFTILVALARQVNTNEFQALWKAAFNFNLARQYYRSHSYTDSVHGFLLTFNFIFSASFTLYLFYNSHHNPDYSNGFSSFLIFLSSMFLFWMARRFLLKLSGWIFQRKDFVDEFIYHNALMEQIWGMIMLPILYLWTFGPDFLEPVVKGLSLLLAGLLGIMVLLRGLQVTRGLLYAQWHHVFIYGVSLEFAPLLILLKIYLSTLQ